MAQKKKFSTELAWLVGLIILAFGVVLEEKADFGMSMVVSPAFILYKKLSEVFPFVTFGMMEYVLQAVLLVLMVLVVRQWKSTYLFSFLTAVVYGLILDGEELLLAFIPVGTLPLLGRIGLYAAGIVVSSVAISLLFKAYLMPEVYELLVKVISEKFHFKLGTVKMIYDLTSCTVSVILSFTFFGMWKFVGVNWGTIVCALVNGVMIQWFTKLFDRHFEFTDTFPWRAFFERKQSMQEA